MTRIVLLHVKVKKKSFFLSRFRKKNQFRVIYDATAPKKQILYLKQRILAYSTGCPDPKLLCLGKRAYAEVFFSHINVTTSVTQSYFCTLCSYKYLISNTKRSFSNKDDKVTHAVACI